jgi:peptidoglycan/LPS O-acetylase OafA/YrhL
MHTMSLAAAYSGIAWVHHLAAALTNFGHAGVDLFFVLSGCVIARIAVKTPSVLPRSAQQNITDAAIFFLRRIVRVFPLYWLTLAVMLTIPTMPGVDNSIATFTPQPLALLLIQIPPAHPVAWTLIYEVQFYLVAVGIMFFGRYAIRAFAVWIALEIGLVALAFFGLAPRFALSDSLSLEFCMGVVIGLWGRDAKPPFPRIMIVSAVVCALAASAMLGAPWIAVTTPARTLVWGIPSAVAVWSALGAERAGLRYARWMVYLGDISYSTYMWHLACLTLTHAVLAGTGLMPGNAGAVLYIIVSAVLILIASTVSYLFFERPINEWVHSVLNRCGVTTRVQA